MEGDNKLRISLMQLVFPIFIREVIFSLLKNFLFLQKIFPKHFDQLNVEKLKNIFQKLFSSIPNTP